MMIINLPRHVQSETLQQALVDAANDLGYKAESRDKYVAGPSYCLVSGTLSRNKIYLRTDIRIGNLFPILLGRINKDHSHDSLLIYPKLFTSRRKVEKYLAAVFKHLGCSSDES